MKITPIEIRKKDFQKVFRGYEKEEVDAFLLSMSQEWERVIEENKEVRKKLEHTEKEVARLREVESSLFRTLKTAEDTGANMIDHANKTAELHLREAQMRAEGIMNEAKSKAKNMIEEAEEKSRDLLEDMQDEAKNLQKEYKFLLDQRDNLLQELKNIANDTLEKVSRSITKTKGLEDKLKEMKSLAFSKSTSPTEEIKIQEVPNIAPPVTNVNKDSGEKKESTGNFFDSI
jgi:cell division initiation protein